MASVMVKIPSHEPSETSSWRRFTILFFRRWKQPGSNHIDHRLQTLVVNSVRIVRGHRSIDVSHDGISRFLVLRIRRFGSEAMPQMIWHPYQYLMPRSDRILQGHGIDPGRARRLPRRLSTGRIRCRFCVHRRLRLRPEPGVNDVDDSE